METVIFLRKKIEGQNSMEELVATLSKEIPDLRVEVLPYYSTSLIGMLKNILFARKRRGDVNHIFSITEGYLALGLGRNTIITVHDMKSLKTLSWIGQIASKILWVLLPSFVCSYYTVISKQTKNELENALPWCKDKTVLIHNPVNPLFKPKAKSKVAETPYILHVGTALHKNLGKVIPAIDGKNVKLIIIGKLFPCQSQLLDKHNTVYENYIDIDLETIVRFYQNAAVLSFPSSYEGFGMPVIEANAAGVPVIAGNIPILHEVGADAALYVSPEDEEELASAFEKILYDRQYCTDLVAKGLVNAKRFSANSIACEYRKLYTAVFSATHKNIK